MTKVIILCLSLAIAITLLLTFSGCRTSDTITNEEDGGVKKYNSGEDSPKSINSSEIISFNCKFSLISLVLEDESELNGRIYTLSADLENESVICKAKWRNTFGDGETKEFKTNVSFMAKLQEIVSKYDFAKHNGYSSTVSGLPDMYGAKLDIKYSSGESIYAYDNQDNFLTLEAIKELVSLFFSAK